MSGSDPGLILVGVGGGGCRLAAAAMGAFGAGLRAVGFDTDALEARAVTGMRCALLGVPRLDGHGTGGDRVKGRLAAQDDLDLVRSSLADVQIAVVVCGLGGGVGGGATPEVLRLMREMGIATLCFATLPFGFEGRMRRETADRAVPVLEENADAVAVVALDDLFHDAGGEGLGEAIRRANATLAAGLTLLWRLLLTPGFVRFDPAQLRTMLQQGGGRCRFGMASTEGESRATRAVEQLTRGALLRRGESLVSARAVALGVLGGDDLRLSELSEVTQGMTAVSRQPCQLRMGTVLDARYAGTLQLVALAFESWQDPAREAASEAPAEGLVPRPRRAGHGRAAGQSKLSFGPTGRGRFRGIEPTLRDGEDLDIPTYVRRSIVLPR